MYTQCTTKPTSDARKCSKCKEAFNVSYFNQLSSKYRLLSDSDKERSPHAAKVIDEIKTKTDNNGFITCDDIFITEKALIRLRPIEAVRQELISLRERYKTMVGTSKYTTYIKMATSERSDELQIRGDADYVLNELHLLYAILPSRQRLKGRLTLISFTITFVCILVTVLLYVRLEYDFTILFITMVSGAIGGLLSIILKIQDMPVNIDVTANFLELKYGRLSVTLAPITGMAFAILLLMLFSTKMIHGLIFPDIIINYNNKQLFDNSVFNDNNIGKVAVWSFLAGFAERLVPDTIDKIISSQKHLSWTRSTDIPK